MSRIEIPGLYLDMPAADYFADPCPTPSLTQSVAKILLEKSPAHARLAHPRLNPLSGPEDAGYEANRIIGNAAHALMLGRGKQIMRLEVTNFRTAKAQELRDEALDAGLIPILPHHYETAEQMVEVGRHELKMRGIDLAECDTEVVIAWKDDLPHGGFWFRSMIDAITRDRLTIFDYKTGGMSAAPHAVDRKMMMDGVHIQAAFHEWGLDTLFPEGAGRRMHWFVFQENAAPYALTAFPLSEEWLTMGRKAVARAASHWCHWLHAGTWPMYPVDVECPPYPGWRMQAELNREIAEAERPGAAATILDAG
jgi:hypothetical protein